MLGKFCKGAIEVPSMVIDDAVSLENHDEQFSILHVQIFDRTRSECGFGNNDAYALIAEQYRISTMI